MRQPAELNQHRGRVSALLSFFTMNKMNQKEKQMNHSKAVETLGNRQSKKLANNTYLHTQERDIALRLHDTDILTFCPDGRTVVRTGGWKTSITKARLNDYLPGGAQIYQQGGLWFWRDGVPFTDGDIVDASGQVQAQGTSGHAKADKALRKSILKFAKLCASKLPLPAPSGGDCWYCCMVTNKAADLHAGDKAETLGDAFKSTDHLTLHMQEGYVVPSLVYHAMKEAGMTDFLLSCAFTAGGFPVGRHVQKAVASYMYRRFGLPAPGGWGNVKRAGFAVR